MNEKGGLATAPLIMKLVSMGKHDKILAAVMSGKRDSNIKFRDLHNMLINLGFTHRVYGNHFVYTMNSIYEAITLQPDGSLAKPYQVKQVRKILQKYKL